LSYSLEIRFSRRSFMSAPQFAEYLSSLNSPKFSGAVIAEINQFNEMNGFPTIKDSELPEYLVSPGGADTFDSDSDNILLALQNTALSEGKPLAVSEEYGKFF